MSRADIMRSVQRLKDPKGFLGPVLILAGGTAGAHLITAGALVIVARLYSPSALGVLGMFSSIVYTLSVAICLRFEVAILLPDKEEEAREVFWLALLSATGLSMMIALLMLIVSRQDFFGFEPGPIVDYLSYIPLALFTVGSYAALQNWYVRKKQYRYLAATRIAQSGSAATVQIGAGLVQPAPLGLIAGFIVNSGAAAILLGYRYWRESARNAIAPAKMSLSRLRAVFRKYSVYPKYSIWEALANSGAIQLPILLIGIMASASEVGFLLLAMSVIQAPLALFGNAVAQVFISQAPEKHREGQLREFTMMTLWGLSKAGALPLLLIGISAPFLFPYIFGAEWSRSGFLVAWMTPWFILQFLAMPVSLALHVTGHQARATALQVFGLVFRLGLVWLALEIVPSFGLEAYALSGAAFYAIYLGVIVATVVRVKR